MFGSIDLTISWQENKIDRSTIILMLFIRHTDIAQE